MTRYLIAVAAVAVFLVLRLGLRRGRGRTAVAATARLRRGGLLGTTGMVAGREIRERVRGRVFRVVTVILLAVVGGAVIIPTLHTSAPSRLSVGVVSGSPTLDSELHQLAKAAGTNAELISQPDEASARASLAAGKLDVVVGSGDTIVVQNPISDTDTSSEARFVRSLSETLGAQRAFAQAGLSPDQVAAVEGARPVAVQSVHPGRKPRTSAEATALLGVILIFVILSQYLTWTLMGVMEEKASRVVEVLLATIRPVQLLGGKVAGIGVVALFQATALVVFALVVAKAVGSSLIQGAAPAVMLATLVWLVLGYAFYSWVYAAAGSMAERQDQVQSMALPLSAPLVFGYVVSLIGVSSGSPSLLVKVLAYLPPTAPFAMPVLVGFEAVTWWQFCFSVLVSIVCTVAVAVVASRVYRTAVLRTGARVRLRDLSPRAPRPALGDGPIGARRAESPSIRPDATVTPVQTVATLIAARRGDHHPGVRDRTGEWTWDETVAASARRGALLADLRQDGPFHLGVLLPNVPEYLFWLGGAALAGAAVVGINPTRRGAALAADVRATDCQLVVTDAEGAALFEGLDLGIDAGRVLVVGTDAYERRLAGIDEQRASDLVANADRVPRDSLFLLLFTSGTTGVPKAVRCTQGRLADIAAVAAPGYGYARESVCYCPMPLFHGNALMALWGPALYAGASVALRPRFSASGFMDDVRYFTATMFSYVGKAIAYLLATPELPDDADNTLVSAFGTEASARDRRAFAKRFGCVLIEGYGQSEGGVAINPERGMPRGALGRPPSGVDLAVVDPETGRECPRARFDDTGRLLNAGEATGEIVNRSGRGKFEGYYGAPEAEAERTRDGWYWTGDLAYRDAEGFFFFAGRRGDWLRVDSENFAAGPVEAVLSRHPDLAVVAVYGVPDPLTSGGDQVMAAVELRPGAAFDPEGFARWLSDQPDLGTKWAPRFVRLSRSLPETATGKVTKVGLRTEGWTTDEEVWWRPDPVGGYRPLSANDRAELDRQVEANRAPVARP